MNMRNEKKRLKREAWETQAAAEEAERRRKESLPMWDRIEEAELSDDLKDILHRLASGEREE